LPPGGIAPQAPRAVNGSGTRVDTLGPSFYRAGVERQSHVEVVEAPVEVCYDTIVDFTRYPEWFSAITTAELVESEPAENRWTVRYGLDMVLKTISYTLAYEGRRPGELRWRLVEGDVRDVEGCYTFTKLEPGLTEAECSQAVDVGFWIPGPLRRIFERSAVADSVREFKAAAESAAHAPRR
jgi:ribosome-associated toxin RatA of RatAB toxin-antitoxin module